MEKHKFDYVTVINRWTTPKYSRNGTWTFFGLSIWYSCPWHYCYKIHLFGIDIHFWFSITYNEKKKD